jgi:hypothetical protein
MWLLDYAGSLFSETASIYKATLHHVPYHHTADIPVFLLKLRKTTEIIKQGRQ